MRKRKETAQVDTDSPCDSPTCQHYRQKILKYTQNRNVVAFSARPSATCRGRDTDIKLQKPRSRKSGAGKPERAADRVRERLLRETLIHTHIANKSTILPISDIEFFFPKNTASHVAIITLSSKTPKARVHEFSKNLKGTKKYSAPER